MQGFCLGDFITWDQALFSFRFENYILAGKAKRKESLGAYHLTENFESSGWKVNGKVTFRKFQPKIEEYVLR